MAYCTLTNVKARIPIDSVDTTFDGFLGTLITRSKAIIDSYTDNTFEKVTTTRKFDVPRNSYRLLLDEWLLACTSVTNGNGVVIPSTEYTLEDYNNPPYYAIVLNPVTSYFWQPSASFNPQRAISVTGDWGLTASVPDDVADAAEQLVVNLYKARDGQNQTANTIITAAGVLQTPTSLPKSVTDLLDPYRKIILSTQTQHGRRWY